VKKTRRILSFLSAGLSISTLIPPRGGRLGALLWLPRPVAEAWILFLGLASGLSALLGLRRRDTTTVVVGLVGALVAGRHIVKVTTPHQGFEQAFGSDWPNHIPSNLQQRLPPQRYTPIPASPPPVPWQRNVVFGVHLETGDPLLADIWQPPANAPPSGLAVIYLHGSGWHYLDKDFGTRHFFRRLANQGHLIMDVAYTLAPKARLLSMAADVKRAIAWLKTHAPEYGVNPERIVLMGGSAGAHLALLAAYAPDHPDLQPSDVEGDTSVRAVVSYYGLPDLRASYDYFQTHFNAFGHSSQGQSRLQVRLEAFLRRIRFLLPYGKAIASTEMVSGLLGGTPDEQPELCHLASPVHHVGPHCPPTLLLQGAHDVGGMAPDVRRLHRALRDAGVTSIHVEYPNTGHGFDLFWPRWSPAAQAATYDAERFLALMV